MMRWMILLLAGLLLMPVGCMATKKDSPKTLSEWGELSRPKF